MYTANILIVRTTIFYRVSFIIVISSYSVQCTEVRFASFLSGGFTTVAVINPPEKKLANRTSVQWLKLSLTILVVSKIFCFLKIEIQMRNS